MGKVWVLDTETKGTGANMVPIEKTEAKPAPKPARPRRTKRSAEGSRPRSKPKRPAQVTSTPLPPGHVRKKGTGEIGTGPGGRPQGRNCDRSVAEAGRRVDGPADRRLPALGGQDLSRISGHLCDRGLPCGARPGQSSALDDYRGERLGKLAEAQTRIERLAEAGVPFERMESAIESTDLPPDEKSALWLLAWSMQDRPVRLRVAREALASVDGA